MQQNVNVLISNLAKSSQQASKQVADLYIASEQLPSVFRDARRNIEAKAKQISRFEEAKDLLVALEQAEEKYEQLQ